MSTPSAFDRIPSVAEVDQITALSDPVIRNLQITQCYHELALAMTQRTGISANWCTFATWASKQAGRTIRREDLANMLENIAFAAQAEQELTASAQALGSPHSEAQIQQTVAEVLNPLRAIERASEAVGRGNRKVFEEIGREFARFYAACLSDSAFNAERIAAFCDSLRLGEPPDGQQMLRQAFTHYYRAFFEPDARMRAELMLLANLEIGFHEQTRLQPEIAEAMSAAFMGDEGVRLRLIRQLFPLQGLIVWLRLFLLRLLRRPGTFDRLLNALLAEMRRQAQLIITRYILTLELPRGVRLQLGKDVPGTFPPSLRQIALEELRALLEQIDPTPDTPTRSGAVDWANLTERLHFIADLFRCYHESEALFDPPFSEAQVAALKAGRLPSGRL
jgi:hypothetical protein